RRRRGGRGELAAEGHEAALALRLAEVEEAEPRLRAPAVFRARLVEGADLEEGRFRERPHGGRLHVVEVGGMQGAEVRLESVPGALPLGVQEVRVVPLVLGTLADPG